MERGGIFNEGVGKVMKKKKKSGKGRRIS